MLVLHLAERADALVEPLANILAEPTADPFAAEGVAVPTRGVERWLAQRLSHHLGATAGGEGGVCANVRFDSPARLVADVLAQVLDLDPDADPWRADRLPWVLLELIDTAVDEPWCAAVARHLGAGDDADPRRGRRMGVATHLARLFATYASVRPQMLLAWAAGAQDDGAGGQVPADLRWQVELWRRLREQLAVPSPAERVSTALDRIADGTATLTLPPRLSLFGPTRLPEDQRLVLQTLALGREVHLWLPHPSPGLWQRVAAAPTREERRRARAADPARHPFLASMARDVVEMEQRLLAVPGVRTTRHSSPEPPGTLLGALQRRLRDDDPSTAPVILDRRDRSVQVHLCHGLSRQVEVLREALAGLFADDPTLEPRDVLVMCPDVEAVAPLVAAAFGTAPPPGRSAPPAQPVHPGRSFRVSVADVSPSRSNPVLSLLSRLLELADGRVTASDVLGLAASAPVRRRFRFGDDDLGRLTQWATSAGVRWGESRVRRARLGLREVAQGTWETGLDRILLGVAMAEEDERFLGSALPLDDVGGTEIDLAGRLAEFLDRLTLTLAALDGVHPLHDWTGTLNDALDRLADTAPDEAWQLLQARDVLADLLASAGGHDGPPLRLADLRGLLARRLEGRPTRAGFRTGALTVCSLEPMRAIPHRVICLVGIDDGVFPRGGTPDGDDVLLREPLVGEHDRRSEDRQIFLDAVAAATDALLVLYTGADERTGAARPPAVPVAELLDALDSLNGETGPKTAMRSHVVRRHHLLDVDERNFVDGALGRPGPFSFDAAAHAAAVAGRAGRTDGDGFLLRPLPATRTVSEVDLADLISVLEHPVRAFVRRRLGVTLPDDTALVDDHLPLQLTGLQQWAVGERLLAAHLGGVDLARAFDVERRRGDVPPRQLGQATLETLAARASAVGRAAASRVRGPARTIDVTAPLPGGPVVTGTVPDVHDGVLLRATYSKLAAKHRIRAWVQLLALAVAFPDQQWRAATVGRSEGSRPTATVSLLEPPTPADAGRVLTDLVALAARAEAEILPIPVAVACAYARRRRAGDPEPLALDGAAKAWGDSYGPSDPYHRLVWGEDARVPQFHGTASAVEARGWPEDRTRLGALGRRIWDPLLAHERTEVDR